MSQPISSEEQSGELSGLMRFFKQANSLVVLALGSSAGAGTAAYFSGYAPPVTNSVLVGVLTGVALFVPLMLCYVRLNLRTVSNARRDRLLARFGVLAVLLFLCYVALHMNFVVSDPEQESTEVTGFVLLPATAEFLADHPHEASSRLLLRSFGGEPENVWTYSSLAIVKFALVASWYSTVLITGCFCGTLLATVWKHHAKSKARKTAKATTSTEAILLAVLALVPFAEEARAQGPRTFQADVRESYGHDLQTSMRPEVIIEKGLLRFDLPFPDGFNPRNASPFEVAAAEQARVEAIRLHRMGDERRRRNWQRVLPAVEAKIAEILAMDRHIGSRQLNDIERDALDARMQELQQLYEGFFEHAIAPQHGATLDRGKVVQAYPVSVYASPVDALVQECNRGTYLLHQKYNRPIPWQTVQLGQMSHFTYGRVMLKASWVDGRVLQPTDWVYRPGFVVIVKPSGPTNGGADDTFPHDRFTPSIGNLP